MWQYEAASPVRDSLEVAGFGRGIADRAGHTGQSKTELKIHEPGATIPQSPEKYSAFVEVGGFSAVQSTYFSANTPRNRASACPRVGSWGRGRLFEGAPERAITAGSGPAPALWTWKLELMHPGFPGRGGGIRQVGNTGASPSASSWALIFHERAGARLFEARSWPAGR